MADKYEVGQTGVGPLWFYLFLEELKLHERTVRVAELKDEFLDLYSTWLKTHDAGVKTRAIAIAQELIRLDVSFTCNVDQCFGEGAPVYQHA